MASITLKVADRWAPGTSVVAHALANWQQGELPPSGAPKGSAAATATVGSDGALSFAGLADDTRYVAAAQVGGVWRYVNFRTPRSGLGTVASGDPFRYDVTRLATLKAAIANRAAAPVRVLAMGDSIVEGDQVSVANRWVNKLADALRTAYPTTGATGGLGFIPALYVASSTITNPIVYAGTKAAVANGLGGGAAVSNGRVYQLSSGATATLAFTGTGIDIVYTKGSTGGNFKWAVDGGAETTVGTNLAATAGGFIEQVRGLSAGAHTIVVTNLTSNTFLEGFVVYNGDETKGFTVYEAGHAGATSGDAMTVGATSSAWDIHRTVAPHLAIIDFGTNDWLVGSAPTSRISPRAMEANLKDLISVARLGETDPSIILVEPAKRGAINSAVAMKGPWSEYIQAIRRVARDDGRVTLFDRQAVMGDQSDGANTLVGADKVHPNTAGHAAIATALASLIASA